MLMDANFRIGGFRHSDRSQIYHGWLGAAEPRPNRNWILQEAAEDTEELANLAF